MMMVALAFMSGCNAFDAAYNRCAPSGSDKGVSYLPLRRWPPLPRSAHTVTLTLLSSFALALRLQVKCNPFVAIFVGSCLVVVGLSCTAFDALGDHKRGLSLTYMQAISTRLAARLRYAHPSPASGETSLGIWRSLASTLQLGVDDDVDVLPVLGS